MVGNRGEENSLPKTFHREAGLPHLTRDCVRRTDDSELRIWHLLVFGKYTHGAWHREWFTVTILEPVVEADTILKISFHIFVAIRFSVSPALLGYVKYCSKYLLPRPTSRLYLVLTSRLVVHFPIMPLLFDDGWRKPFNHARESSDRGGSLDKANTAEFLSQ